MKPPNTGAIIGPPNNTLTNTDIAIPLTLALNKSTITAGPTTNGALPVNPEKNRHNINVCKSLEVAEPNRKQT